MRARTDTNPHGAGGWEGHPYESGVEHVYFNGQDYPRSEVGICIRCGVTRIVRAGRPGKGRCRDCYQVESTRPTSRIMRLDAGQPVRVGLIWRWPTNQQKGQVA